MKQNLLFFSTLIMLSLCFPCEQMAQGTNTSHSFIVSMHNLERTNTYIKASNKQLVASIDRIAMTKTQYKPLVSTATKVQNLTTKFHLYINELKKLMAQESNGVYTKQDTEAQENSALIGLPKDGNNKTAVEQIFISRQDENPKQEPRGAILYSKLRQLRADYIQAVADLWDNEGIPNTIFADDYRKEDFLLKLSNDFLVFDYNQLTEKTTWTAQNFKDKTIEGAYISLTQYQNQVNLSAATVLKSLAEQIDKFDLSYDKFEVFAQASKPYILLGETYETEITLGAYATKSKFLVSVDGTLLPITDGKAIYRASGSRIGEKSFEANISVKNPLTGEMESVKKTFKYEVGQPAVMAAADKQNILYVGLDNPISIAAAGINTSRLKVSINGGTLEALGKTSYVARAKKPGNAVITVADTKNGKKFPFKFRVKRIPNPTVKMGNHIDGIMEVSEFKTQLGLEAVLEDFDFDPQCQVESYTLIYTPKGKKAVLLKGTGGSFSGKIIDAVKKVKSGDQYTFTDVTVRCAGDQAGRRVNGLFFRIK